MEAEINREKAEIAISIAEADLKAGKVCSSAE